MNTVRSYSVSVSPKCVRRSGFRLRRLVGLVSFLAFLSGPSWAARIYVDSAAAPGGNGSTWVLAYQTINQGLTAATSGDEVWVASGTYSESLYWGSSKNGVSLYGSFDKTEAVVGDRDIAGNPTVIDASTADSGGPADHVIQMESVVNTRLDGFTLTGGVANGASIPHFYGGGLLMQTTNNTNVVANCTVVGNTADYGGGIHVRDGSPVFQSCLVESNTGTYGGGVYTYNCSPTFTLCDFIENHATSQWGAMALFYSTGSLTDCRFIENSADSLFAALMLYGSSPTITGCSFLQNCKYNEGGGGISTMGDSDPIISSCLFLDSEEWGGPLSALLDLEPSCTAQVSDCVILGARGGRGVIAAGNSSTFTNCVIAGHEEGGVFLMFPSCDVLFENCIISGNSTPYAGGAIVADYSAKGTFVNCLITGNQASSQGGAVFSSRSGSTVLINCTVTDNEAGADGGAIYSGESSSWGMAEPEAINTIFYNNSGYTVYVEDAEATASLKNCLFHATESGVFRQEGLAITAPTVNDLNIENPLASGNVEGDPLFATGVSGTWTSAPTYDAARNRTLLIDTAAGFTPDTLLGAIVNPNTGQRFQAVVTSNTLTAVEVIGDFTAIVSSGDPYEFVDYHIQDGSAALERGLIAAAPATDFYEADPRPGADALVDIGVDEANPAFTRLSDIGLPVSEVRGVAEAQYTQQFDVPYVASDADSGVQYVRLFYRRDGGSWTQYGSTFTASPIAFDASSTGGDGYYEFYSLATDNASNDEASKSSPEDATVVVSATGVQQVYVDQDATGSGSGLTWADALPTIEEGIHVAKANAVDVVWVADGVYKESLVLPGNLQLYGGFSGTESALSERSGAVTAIDASEAFNGSSAYHVLRIDGVTNVLVEGFTLTGGSAGEVNTNIYGGGVLIQYTDDTVVIRDCVVVQNQALYGGGFLVQYANPRIEQCSITDNYASQLGGAMYCREAPISLINSEILRNQVFGALNCGGVRFYISSPEITNCTISENESTGIHLYNNSVATITNCIISGSEAQGIYEGTETCDAAVQFTHFYNNGGGDYHDDDTATDYTGAAAIEAAVPETGNLSDGDPLFAPNLVGTWTQMDTQDPIAGTTLLTDSTASFVPGALRGKIINVYTGGFSPWYYPILDNTANTITVVGLAYVYSGDGYEIPDYKLSASSPCVDTGTATGAPAVDIAGNPRPLDIPGVGYDGVGQGYDIGAWELTAVFADAVVTAPSDPIDFGTRDTSTGPSPAQTVVIQSTGVIPLQFTGAGIEISGTNASEFLFSGTLNLDPIASGNSRNIDIVFDPDTLGPKNAVLTITTNDPGEPTITIGLIGLAAPSATAAGETWVLYR